MKTIHNLCSRSSEAKNTSISSATEAKPAASPEKPISGTCCRVTQGAARTCYNSCLLVGAGLATATFTAAVSLGAGAMKAVELGKPIIDELIKNIKEIEHEFPDIANDTMRIQETLGKPLSLATVKELTKELGDLFGKITIIANEASEDMSNASLGDMMNDIKDTVLSTAKTTLIAIAATIVGIGIVGYIGKTLKDRLCHRASGHNNPSIA